MINQNYSEPSKHPAQNTRAMFFLGCLRWIITVCRINRIILFIVLGRNCLIYWASWVVSTEWLDGFCCIIGALRGSCWNWSRVWGISRCAVVLGTNWSHIWLACVLVSASFLSRHGFSCPSGVISCLIGGIRRVSSRNWSLLCWSRVAYWTSVVWGYFLACGLSCRWAFDRNRWICWICWICFSRLLSYVSDRFLGGWL